MRHLATFPTKYVATAIGLAAFSSQIVCGAGLAYRNAVTADGPVAYYEFDATSGTIAVDTASVLGGANNGAILGGAALNQPSAFSGLGTAFAFDGSDDRVRILDNAVFDFGAGAFTIELWYKTNADSRGDLFTYKGGGGDFGIHSNSQADPLGFNASVSVYINGFTASPAGADTGAWHHVAFTRDGAGNTALYVDGDLRGTGNTTNSLNIANDLLIGSNFGADVGTPAIQFNGLIDEVAIYGSALTETQIDNHIAAAVPEPGVSCLLLGATAVVLGGWRRRAGAAQGVR